MLLTSLYVWLTFATDRKLRNAVEIGKFPPQKVSFNLHFPTFRGGVCVQSTDLSQANSLPVVGVAFLETPTCI